jgi:hypothetical protein
MTVQFIKNKIKKTNIFIEDKKSFFAEKTVRRYLY